MVSKLFETILGGTNCLLKDQGLSRTAIFTALDASLERLETDYIDFFWIHRFDPHTPIEETMRALHDLVTAGKIRYIGASSMWTYQFAQMQFCAEKNGWTKFVAMQVRSDFFGDSTGLFGRLTSSTE